MTLMEAILRQVRSSVSLGGGHGFQNGHLPKSPPPESEVIEVIQKEHQTRRKRSKFAKTRPKVDTSPPRYSVRHMFKKIPDWAGKRRTLDAENMEIVLAIKKTHFTRGRVDSHWKKPLEPYLRGYYNRLNFIKRVSLENKIIYKRINDQGPKVVTTASLMEDWARNRNDIIIRALNKFVLFPPIPRGDIEDPAFVKPKGVTRPRVFFTLSFEGGSNLGELQAELFTDVCPKTCQLFSELLGGDGVGFSYVGTHFFRKVPHMYWVGGDVARDNGFGCYAQRGRRVPIGAENYHFSHSMPGLLSMPVTCDDEVCGIFNITFKALPQLDLRNIVFGRIIRPSHLFNGITHIGKLLSTQPSVVMSASRQSVDGQWVQGTPNTRMEPERYKRKIHFE